MDVKLLLECGDHETIEEAHRLDLDTLFDIIEVPNSSPQTKPKAFNYGLQLARGDYVVIYDAEDQPEPDQLLKAVAAFRASDDTLACVQARLNFYNRNENWLTQLFTLEYSLWFDWLLCALERIGAPIPLGGTSNFIKTDILIEQGGWDAFNVTEDADLGLRLSKRGYKTALLDSTTYEEANCTLNNWVRQRSRWLKGYLQTWLVHMRRPAEIINTTGWTGFLSIQLLLAGNVFSAIVNPAMWLIFLSWLAFEPHMISAIFPEPLLQLNLFAFFIGNFVFIALMIIAPLRRGWWTLTAAGITAPIYWLITSIAGYMAVWQLLTKPFYWEKTDHMLSSVAQKQREELMAKGTL